MISPMDWEEYVTEIATDMMKEQSPKGSFSSKSFSLQFITFIPPLSLSSVVCFFRLFQVRGKVYELLVNCIPPEVILKVLKKNQFGILLYIHVSFSFFIYPLFMLFQRLLHELLKRLDAELKLEVCNWAAYYVRLFVYRS